jgi:hypothetical protein
MKTTKHRRGRGAQKDSTKVPTTVRLDADVLAFFKAGGPGCQTRINAELRKVATKDLAARLGAQRLAILGGSEPQLKPVPRRRTAPA